MFGWLSGFFCKLFGCPQEVISIFAPTSGATITSPVTISGRGRAAQHNQLSVEIRDSSNAVVGSGTASITAALGQPGPFTTSITFTPGAPGTPGTVQVFDSSPATGALVHLSAVMVRF